MRIEKSALCNVLSELRVTGAVVLGESYEPPWAIDVPAGTELGRMMEVDADVTVVPFHLVSRGHFELLLQDGAAAVVREGQAVLCTNGQGHRMMQGNPRSARSFHELIDGNCRAAIMPGEAGSTEIICGVFLLRNTKNNPLIDALPSLVHVDVSGRAGTQTLRQLRDLLLNELAIDRSGRAYMIERVLELFYAEAIRVYAESAGDNAGGWLQALKDRRMAGALNYIHKDPGRALSVSILARQVALSPSRFAARFRELLGQSPMAYVAAWRLNLAARRLVESKLSVEEIAHSCGYVSLPGFNRAFAKHHGMPPARWRKEAAGGLTASS